MRIACATRPSCAQAAAERILTPPFYLQTAPTAAWIAEHHRDSSGCPMPKRFLRDLMTRAFRSRKPRQIRKEPQRVGRRIEELEDRVVPATGYVFAGVPTFGSGFTGMVGSRFTVSQTTAVERLGALDVNGNGFNAGSATVGLWTLSGTLLASTTVNNSSVAYDSLFGSPFRYSAPFTAVTLSPGDYVVGVHYPGGDQYAYNASVAGNGPVSYVTSRESPNGSGFTFPFQQFGTPGGFFGANFLQGPPTLSSSATVTVNEGGLATTSASFVGAGEPFSITSNVGSVSFSGGINGTWTWSYPTTDGPAQGTTVVVTATGLASGRTQTTSFQLGFAPL